jgi:hypothetical protein
LCFSCAPLALTHLQASKDTENEYDLEELFPSAAKAQQPEEQEPVAAGQSQARCAVFVSNTLCGYDIG